MLTLTIKRKTRSMDSASLTAERNFLTRKSTGCKTFQMIDCTDVHE